MLRKELKELAQRSLKGKYGKWSIFIIIPFTIMAITLFFSFIFFGIASLLNYTDDYSSGYYDDAYYDDGFGSDFWDNYWDDDHTYDDLSYTPAYNYGYALGYQAGYLQGWQDQENSVEYWGTLTTDQAILANIENRPIQFLGSDDFNSGTLDAYYFSYDEAWEDYQGYTIDGNSYLAPNIPELNQVSPTNNGFEPYFPESGYTEMPRRSNPFISFLVGFIFFVILVAVALLYGCVYVPLLRWAGIDTIDGENFTFKDSLKKIGNQFGVVFWANFKIAFFTFLWSFLLVIPGIIKTASYSMTNYLLKREPKLNSAKAIALSQELMRGYKIEYLVFNLSFFWWFLLEAYSFGFASFYVLPYYYTAEAAFFDEIYFEKRRYSAAEVEEETIFRTAPATEPAPAVKAFPSINADKEDSPAVNQDTEEETPLNKFEKPSYSFGKSTQLAKETTVADKQELEVSAEVKEATEELPEETAESIHETETNSANELTQQESESRLTAETLPEKTSEESSDAEKENKEPTE